MVTPLKQNTTQDRAVYGRRRTLEKTLRPIAEEHSLSDGELMDGLRPTFPAASAFKAGG